MQTTMRLASITALVLSSFLINVNLAFAAQTSTPTAPSITGNCIPSAFVDLSTNATGNVTCQWKNTTHVGITIQGPAKYEGTITGNCHFKTLPNIHDTIINIVGEKAFKSSPNWNILQRKNHPQPLTITADYKYKHWFFGPTYQSGNLIFYAGQPNGSKPLDPNGDFMTCTFTRTAS